MFRHVLSNIVKHPNARSCGPQNYPECHNNFNMAESAMVQRKCLAAIILIELLEEDEKRGKGRGKTRSWMRRRKEKGYFNNIVRELMIEDTAGYREMMRMTHDEFVEILKLIEPDITPRQVIGGYKFLYNNKINARVLIGQSAMVYRAGKPMEKSRVF